MRVLLIDNYDSFTWNLAQLFMGLGAEVEVVRNDAIDLAGIAARRPDRIVLSPGPGRPERAEDFGICAQVLRQGLGEIPLLGVCLGHQGLVHALGGRVIRAPEPRHGKVSILANLGGRLFAGLPPQFAAMRYHSLLAERTSLPACLRIVAETVPESQVGPVDFGLSQSRIQPSQSLEGTLRGATGGGQTAMNPAEASEFRNSSDMEPPLVMAVEHLTLPVYGVQFHPESIGTPLGAAIAANFLAESAAQHLTPLQTSALEAA